MLKPIITTHPNWYPSQTSGPEEGQWAGLRRTTADDRVHTQYDKHSIYQPAGGVVGWWHIGSPPHGERKGRRTNLCLAEPTI